MQSRALGILGTASVWTCRLTLAVASIGFLSAGSCGWFYTYDDDDCHRHDDDDEYYHCHDDDDFPHDDDDDFHHFHGERGSGDSEESGTRRPGAPQGTRPEAESDRASGTMPATPAAPAATYPIDLSPYRLRDHTVTTGETGVRELTGMTGLSIGALFGPGVHGTEEFRSLTGLILLANEDLIGPPTAGERLVPSGVRIGREGVLVGYALRSVDPDAEELGGDPAVLFVFDAHGDLLRIRDATRADRLSSDRR